MGVERWEKSTLGEGRCTLGTFRGGLMSELTLVDVDGGQGAGSPVLSQAPPPPIPSGQIKDLVQYLCAQQNKQAR